MAAASYTHDAVSRKRNLSLAAYQKRKADDKAAFKAAQPARKAARRDQINENQQRRQQVDEDRVVREAHRVMRRQVYRTQCMRNAEPADTFSRRVNSARADSFAQYCRVLEAVEMATVISMAAELEAAAGGAISAADAEVFSSPKEYFQFLARRQFCQDSNKAMYDASNAALKLADGKYREAALDVRSAKDESGKRRLEYDTPGGPRALFVARGACGSAAHRPVPAAPGGTPFAPRYACGACGWGQSVLRQCVGFDPLGRKRHRVAGRRCAHSAVYVHGLRQ